MERKAKVTQEAVNSACEKLNTDNQAVTVNAVIATCGGSFSTVGPMVKVWKQEQENQVAPVLEMPEAVTTAMHKAIADVWSITSQVAGEAVERAQSEAKQVVLTAKNELTEYVDEVSRLEQVIVDEQRSISEIQSHLDKTTQQVSDLTIENTSLQTRLSDRDQELNRLRQDYEKLQAELLNIAKKQSSVSKSKSKTSSQ